MKAISKYIFIGLWLFIMKDVEKGEIESIYKTNTCNGHFSGWGISFRFINDIILNLFLWEKITKLINRSVFNFNYKNKINLICKQLDCSTAYRNCHKQFISIWKRWKESNRHHIIKVSRLQKELYYTMLTTYGMVNDLPKV